MNDRVIKINEEILLRTTRCKYEFCCLSGDKACLCKVTSSVGFDIKVIKPTSKIDCNYLLSHGNGSLCVCPTRNELYNRYKV